MDRDEIRSRISGLNIWKRGDQRAPHKPLLLLYALKDKKQEGRAMDFEIPLERMSTSDKLRALEIIREDLPHPG